ncbi:MAG TPA: DUF2610 domain-containing protein [Rickettsiales bacterium]|nr:DUF2610 domain-containing protein [Rickettsiales bacterium]
MKSFGIPCDFNGQKQTILFYIGAPHPDQHPIYFQSNWLSSMKGGVVPNDIMESISKLHGLSKKYKVSFEELCYYAINVANGNIENNNKGFSKIIEEMNNDKK